MGQENSNSNRLAMAFLNSQKGLERYVRRLVGNREGAEDIVHEAFVNAYAASEQTEIEHPTSYLFTTAKRLVIRDRSRLSTILTDYIEDYSGPALSSNEGDGFEKIAAREELNELGAAMEAMPAQCRKVMLLRMFYGMSQREIAKTLGISESTTEKHIAKGFSICETRFRRKGIDRSRKRKRNVS
ncbi:RNA polymerase sigma factor [Hyphococcus lacteus]|uniref:RNA polymerase sigma factor n=1 Tax=Hyphococcus lacteus TaxID=3143536 RepID=A0ABV3Z4K0_9PROT